ncbi:polysaccharide deacetylase family protein [Streptomyces beijiangensis]|uniref:Polysaccharide deacetylase family protein n=1 Tax=Streptomyces beijiangensis TaxID=163361 RepID=A0A939FCF0_9ACTN|nr:polysaccharide deacetylase family protein [Streptomyces beijiangensis]MBO0516505.1 polysaccharide deacetylase family protein [Streptomyces beijiangensis]
MRKKVAGLVLGSVLGGALIAGCTSGSGSGPGETHTPAASAPGKAPSTAHPDARAAAFRKWGLKPFAPAPAPPAIKPVKIVPGAPVPVISEIPTKKKIVFVTFDDGAEKDPKFVAMMKELKIPFTMFLMNDAIRSDYGYFKPLQALGNRIENHTLHHPNMRTLGAAAQKNEVCGQETKLTAEYGSAPRLFRPPYGNWNAGTRAAVKDCGLKAIVLWRESMQIKNMQYQRTDKKLHPGDIILAHFRGPTELKGHSMTEMTANMLRHIQKQGFTVARLEDYL